MGVDIGLVLLDAILSALLEGQCHEIFTSLLFKSGFTNRCGPLIGMLKYFGIGYRFEMFEFLTLRRQGHIVVVTIFKNFLEISSNPYLFMKMF